jgi:TrmH family RNA methyltransferase
MIDEQAQTSRHLQLTSSKNPLLKEVRRAIEKGTLTESGLCVAETFHLLEEAIRSDCEIPVVIAADSVFSTVERRVQGLRTVQLIRVADALFGQIAATENSQGVMALVKPRVWDIDQLFRGQSLIVVLDGVQDPGNAGAIVRAAEAFGATGVILVRGTVSPHNPKTLRASAGSLFRMPFVSSLEEGLALAAITQRRLDLYAAMPRAERLAGDVNLRRRCALVIGSEGKGVSAKFASAALDIRIPTRGVESLNASMAAGILLYEAFRQRQLPDEPV